MGITLIAYSYFKDCVVLNVGGTRSFGSIVSVYEYPTHSHISPPEYPLYNIFHYIIFNSNVSMSGKGRVHVDFIVSFNPFETKIIGP